MTTDHLTPEQKAEASLFFTRSLAYSLAAPMASWTLSTKVNGGPIRGRESARLAQR